MAKSASEIMVMVQEHGRLLRQTIAAEVAQDARKQSELYKERRTHFDAIAKALNELEETCTK